MILNELLIYANPSSAAAAPTYFRDHNLNNVEINSTIFNFIAKFKSGEEITPNEFDEFNKELNKLYKAGDYDPIRSVIISILFDIAHEIYDAHKADIQDAVDIIDQSLKKSNPIPQQKLRSDRYIDLINVYRLMFQQSLKGRFINEGDPYIVYPGIGRDERKVFGALIPFAINALTLTGQISKTFFNGPLYPLHLEDLKITGKIPVKRGIKVSDDYYPYKPVSKIYKGDTGNNTFLVTNGVKTLFMRGARGPSANGVFASKIATMVSSKHFSSERLMDNKIVGSRGIDGYAVSVADETIQSAMEKYIKQDKRVFPGTGIIDEVCNYVNETDANIENFGFSSRDINSSNTYISKIDFDRCYPTFPRDYEVNLLSNGGIYYDTSHVQHDQNYQKEKLYARLKLCMLTEPLLLAIADKSFGRRNGEEVEKTVRACITKSDTALKLFCEHPYAKQFLKKNPQILDQCYREIVLYVKDHFDEAIQNELFDSLTDRTVYISKNLQKNLRIEPLISAITEMALQNQQQVPNATLKEIRTGFKNLLKQLNSQREQLNNKAKTDSRYKVVAGKIDALYQTLDEEQQKFFIYPTKRTFQTFTGKLTAAIAAADLAAKKHRGWHGISPIIRGILGVIAALMAIPALVIETQTKHGFIGTFFKTPETNTSQKLNDFITQYSHQKVVLGKAMDSSEEPLNSP